MLLFLYRLIISKNMNFQTLKAMIENLIKSFTCPACNSAIAENSIEIIWAAGTTVNIDIECPNCKKHALIKAELAINESVPWISREKLELLKNLLKWMSTKFETSTPMIWENLQPPSQIQTQTTINEKEILELRENFKNKKLSVSELFSDTNE